jgi:hypothetical protein
MESLYLELMQVVLASTAARPKFTLCQRRGPMPLHRQREEPHA